MLPRDGVHARDVVAAWAARPARSVIFDFNGTLSDDEDILQRIFTELFAEHLGWTLTPEEYRARLLGRSDREIVEIAVEASGAGADLVEPLLAQRQERYKQAVAEHSPITPATTELVQRLAKAEVPMAIVTGAQREDVVTVLDRSVVGGLITTLVTEEDVTRGKPDPEGFLLGAAALRVDPADVLVFEDSVPGALGATRAGMACIAVTRGQADPELLAVAPAHVRVPGVDLLRHTDL